MVNLRHVWATIALFETRIHDFRRKVIYSYLMYET